MLDPASFRSVQRRVLLATLFLVLTSCSPRTVTRINDDRAVDLSGYWNDTDSRLVSEQMIAEALGTPWIENFIAENGRRPVVLFDGIRNRTAEHIPQQAFLNSIQRHLVNAQRVIFVANGEEREDLRAERRDQAENASAATMNAERQERGADFLLGGEISYIEDANEKDQLRVYQVDLRFLSLRDNTISWAGQKIIRKAVGRSRWSGVEP